MNDATRALSLTGNFARSHAFQIFLFWRTVVESHVLLPQPPGHPKPPMMLTASATARQLAAAVPSPGGVSCSLANMLTNHAIPSIPPNVSSEVGPPARS